VTAEPLLGKEEREFGSRLGTKESLGMGLELRVRDSETNLMEIVTFACMHDDADIRNVRGDIRFSRQDGLIRYQCTNKEHHLIPDTKKSFHQHLLHRSKALHRIASLFKAEPLAPASFLYGE
jgi:hypothetical protein